MSLSKLSVIEQHLNIVVGDKLLHDGKRKKNKNKYYYYAGQYYIINLVPNGNVWMIADDSPKTRRLLKDHFFTHSSEGYAKAYVNGKTTTFHKLCTEYECLPDHINRLKYDNRTANLRETGYSGNMRNKTTYSNNKSGKQGVAKCMMNKIKYWRASIVNDSHKVVRKCYSIKKYGDDEAKQMAIDERKRLENLYGYIGE